ncbi:MAG: hypothetical protein ABIJ16_02345 [Bacteroidota bacterium]
MKTTGTLKRSVVLLVFFLALTGTTKLFSCEIVITVDGEQKEIYKPGDEIVINVKITFTHRVCNAGIKQTTFDSKGLDILTATDWKETSPGVWERKLKVKVTGTKKGKLFLTATRTCDKEGGFGSLTLDGKPLEE